MSTRNIVRNIRSAEVIQGKPKLPTSGQLDFGEIAINYAEDHETLSFKNNSNKIVSLSVKTVDDVKVNGNSVVSNKTANITMKGSTTPVADTYPTTTFPSSFNAGAEHISASDNVDAALKKVETNISKLVGKLDFYYGNLNNDVNNLEITINRLQEITSSIPTMEYVNLGLPSGTLWAKCNIGAPTETDYGDYFMWGSTTPDNNHTCNWANTPFNNGSNDYNADHFNSVKDTLCPDGVLAKEFDAAYKATNGIARMPTAADIKELLDNTEYKWFENYNSSGVKGRKFTGSNGNSIFIPAAGWRFNSSFESRGISGYFWSSTLMTSDPKYAWGIIFGSDADNITESQRHNGCVVRAVRK